MSQGFFGPDDFALNMNTQSWPAGQSHMDFSTQAAIVHERGNSVVDHYGQITPPEDGTPFAAPRGAEPDAKMSAKSERARNAANQRHAKAKKVCMGSVWRLQQLLISSQARRDSSRTEASTEVEAEVVDDKREKYREKNRLAAAKCRAKKKNNTEDLEESARIITSANSRLRAQERELRDIFSNLRHQALAHDQTQGCTCSAIHMYNNNKAQEAARGAAMGLAAYGSVESGRSRTTPEGPRTQSFSSGKGSCFRHSESSNSEVGPGRGYMVPTTGVETENLSGLTDMAASDFAFSPSVGNSSMSPLGEDEHLGGAANTMAN